MGEGYDDMCDMRDDYYLETEYEESRNKVSCHVHPKQGGWDKGRTKPVGCKCGEPLMIVIPPGEHVHPCPVHPEYVVYGTDVRM